MLVQGVWGMEVLEAQRFLKVSVWVTGGPAWDQWVLEVFGGWQCS